MSSSISALNVEALKPSQPLPVDTYPKRFSDGEVRVVTVYPANILPERQHISRTARPGFGN